MEHKTPAQKTKEWRHRKQACVVCNEVKIRKGRGMCSTCYNIEWRKTEKARAAIKKSNDERNGRRKRNGKTVWGSNLWHELAEKSCAICGWNEASRDIHHIIPRRNGGDNSRENLITLCPNHHRMVEEGLIELNPAPSC